MGDEATVRLDAGDHGGSAPSARSRRTRSSVLPLTVAGVLALGAGVTAGALALGGDDKSRAGGTDTSAARAGFSDDEQRTATIPNAAGSATVKAKPQGTPTQSDVGGAPDPTSSGPGDETSAPSGDASEDSAGDVAADVIRGHWEAIGSGDYDGAYSRFSPGYASGISRDRWVGRLRGYRPDVNVIEVALQKQLSTRRAWVYVDVVTRDRGDAAQADSSRCNRFAGRVVVERADGGTWGYSPSATGATWKPQGSLEPDDPRCDDLF